MIDRLIAHRFRGFAPEENTVPGLLAALDFGVSYVEFDVRMAKCGTPMVYHDEHALSRSGRQLLSEVMARDFARVGGRLATMPTLDALLEAAARHESDATLLVDIKDAGFAEAIRALVRLHGLAERVVYVSWLPEVLYAVKAIEPEARLCFSHWASSPSLAARATHEVFTSADGDVPCPENTPFGTRSGWWLKTPLEGELLEMVDWVCVPKGDVTEGLVAHYRERGVGVSAFAYVETGKVRDALAKGVDLAFVDARRVFEEMKD